MTPLTIVLASPRGFCAGVDRAIHIVERSIELYGAPVYVRHEIVHNQFVVESLKQKGAVFVDELDEVPDDRPVVFSAHGVPKTVPSEAERRKMIFLDATCPLVTKVHREAEMHYEAGRQIIMIGHAGHPEVIGTLGQVPDIGAPNSSNSRRLVEVAARAGCPNAVMVQRAEELDWSIVEGVTRLGITAGASAPELLVSEVIAAARARFDVTIEEVKVTDETIAFKLPPTLSGEDAVPALELID